MKPYDSTYYKKLFEHVENNLKMPRKSINADHIPKIKKNVILRDPKLVVGSKFES